ncbi:MAG: malate synthase A [Nocardiopsis sp. BM-2018]|nr:MAG: malate synthase A [Nocardiopsis sp. BM-2018]
MSIDHAPVPAGVSGADTVMTAEALAFVAELHDRFDGRRRALLDARAERQRAFDAGALPAFRDDGAEIRAGDWRVAPAPADLDDRRVEITGPLDRKMMINALNSGAKVFMADAEDALSPTWANVVAGQVNLRDAVRRTLTLTDPSSGKHYALGDELATLVVRPRGWHLEERHVRVDGAPVSGALFDAGMYLFHNAAEALARGSGPYLYLAKLESREEARLWNDVFVHAQAALGLPRGSVRATVLIETILAAFEMEEILFELREHASGLNAGRWDYIFSVIKTFRRRRDMVLPDRSAVTMTVPFMAAYADRLVQTCHRRGAHAIGGMAAFIPNRRDPAVTERALRKVREDKELEASKGFDGTWVAHPDLVGVARDVFDAALGAAPHQKGHPGPRREVSGSDLLDTRIEGAAITLAGVETNVRVALQYTAAWLGGLGAVAIDDLMEDAATAEISRAQLWQWLRAGVRTAEGAVVDADLYRSVRSNALAALAAVVDRTRLEQAGALLDTLVLAERFETFLTLPAYEVLRGAA